MNWKEYVLEAHVGRLGPILRPIGLLLNCRTWNQIRPSNKVETFRNVRIHAAEIVNSDTVTQLVLTKFQENF